MGMLVIALALGGIATPGKVDYGSTDIKGMFRPRLIGSAFPVGDKFYVRLYALNGCGGKHAGRQK